MRASAKSSAKLLKEMSGHKRRSLSLVSLLCLCAAMLLSLSGCSKRPVEEIVTTDASRSSGLPAGAQPIAKEPKLPTRDADIEAAGDRIAEAITYLSSKRREAALHALGQSETALNRALRAHARDDRITASLRTTLKDLDTAERSIQRGSTDVAKQLATINRNLDGLDLQRAEQAEAATSQPQ